MKFIPLGLQCSVSEGILYSGKREYSYPFDWLWCPSKTTYEILMLLLNKDIEAAVDYMTVGYVVNYKWLGNENFLKVESQVPGQLCQINTNTGHCNSKYIINDDHKNRLRRRFKRMLDDIYSEDHIKFIYADAASPEKNYRIDNIEYGVNGTEYLIKIYDLLISIRKNFEIVYFCWNERCGDNIKITYIPYNYKDNWGEVSRIISNYILNL
jgi:hypothetical protein